MGKKSDVNFFEDISVLSFEVYWLQKISFWNDVIRMCSALQPKRGM